MPKVQWTCHYGYPGCASWEPCNACANDFGLWRQITAGLTQARRDHEHEQQKAPTPPKPTGIVLEERMDGGCLVVSDTGRAMNLTAYQRTFWDLRGPDDGEQDR